MIALGLGATARTLFSPGELLKAAVKRFHLCQRVRVVTSTSYWMRIEAKLLIITHSMSPFGATGLTKRTAKGACLRRTSSPVLHPPGGGATASNTCYPTCLLALTNRLLIKVVRNVQPARRINFRLSRPLYRTLNGSVRARKLPSATTWANRAWKCAS